jgi:hypothetical protein
MAASVKAIGVAISVIAAPFSTRPISQPSRARRAMPATVPTRPISVTRKRRSLSPWVKAQRRRSKYMRSGIRATTGWTPV